jgi:hypothetical protein
MDKKNTRVEDLYTSDQKLVKEHFSNVIRKKKRDKMNRRENDKQ